MRITTIAEARELVGRTFERDCERRTIKYIALPASGFLDGGLIVYGSEDGGGADRPRDMSAWLSGATEVTDG